LARRLRQGRNSKHALAREGRHVEHIPGAPIFDPGEKGGKLVVATDRSQDLSQLTRSLARWLMPAGFFVELAENDRRAREVLASEQISLTIASTEASHPVP
jgi:hypothetical protein